MVSPYSPPEAPEPGFPEANRKIRFWKTARWISLALIVLPPIAGISGTVLGMIRAFGELAEDGEADPAILAGDISEAMLTTLYGMLVSLIGVILLIVAIRRLRVWKRSSGAGNQA